MIVHWDDVAWEQVDCGELRWSRQRLVPGLSRFRAEPGARIMPAHVHVDEEELVVVLAGAGVSWQDGEAHPIGARDVVLHRPDAEAHTLAAGDSGLEVLIFGSGSPTGLTRLPRAGVIRVGAGCWPLGADPFAAEPPLELPADAAPRPRTIAAIDDVPGEHRRRGPTDIVRRNVGDALGSVISGLRTLEIAPGARGYPHHCHSAEDERFVVLEGSGTLRLGDDRHDIRAGHVLARPAGTGVAHSFWGGDGGVVVLAHGTRDPSDLCFYPDSDKILAGGLNVVFRVEPLDYWDGEE